MKWGNLTLIGNKLRKNFFTKNTKQNAIKVDEQMGEIGHPQKNPVKGSLSEYLNGSKVS